MFVLFQNLTTSGCCLIITTFVGCTTVNNYKYSDGKAGMKYEGCNLMEISSLRCVINTDDREVLYAATWCP